MIAEIEQQIRQNVSWVKLPTSLKQSLGNSQKEYEKMAINYSIKNQLRHKGNLVRTIRKDERKYYEELLKYSRDHLMLYPYHLSDVMVKGLRVTPFAYYTSVMADIMTQEKSYDSLPNFTAADCLRLMAIGRNQYIDIMNQCRSSKKFFRKKPLRELLPRQPVDSVLIEPWWVVQHGYIVEEDIKLCTVDEKKVIDRIIDNGPQLAGCMDFHVLHRLYRKGLVYLDVPITDDDHIIVPPLEGFVMNRVLGDYFETLLYKIFVSIDEHTSIAELSKVLEIDLQLVKNAISMFCRLGFGRKKVMEPHSTLLHESWSNIELTNNVTKKPTEDQLLLDWANMMNDHNSSTNQINSPDSLNYEDNLSIASSVGHMKRIAFMFDSTLTAFLMMGNLSPGLKSHAVTMFEVGKLSDESLDSFLAELNKVDSVAEGEAQRYFDHAVTLRDTVQFLRYNRNLANDPFMTSQQVGQGLDLLRCESLLGLDTATCSRVLNKNYSLLVSVAPLSNEVRPVSNNIPHHLGPAIPEVNSIWFKLFIYSLTGNGPPSLLLVKGTKLRKYPKVLRDFDRVLVTTWGHDPAVISSSNVLLILNDALAHSALLVQGHGTGPQEGQTVNIPFPLTNGKSDGQHRLERHTAVQRLDECIDLRRTCGYLTMLKTGRKGVTSSEDSQDNCISPSGGGDKDEKVYRGMTPFDLPTPCIEVAGIEPSLSLYNGNQNDSVPIALGSPDLHTTEGRTTNQVPPPDGITASQKQDREKLKLELGNSGREKPTSVEEYEEDDWVLFDCCFGIPLFDRQVNKTVCQRIESHKLCHEMSLKELSLSNRRLGGELLKFVRQNQMMASEEDSQSSGSNHSHGNVPLPTRNLVFDNEKLSVWDGV